jgi:hypothetical protein
MTLYIPAELWVAATDSLLYHPHDRERVAFFDGPRPSDGGPAVATTLVLPELVNTWGNYRVSAEAMSRAGKHLRALGMLRFAQLHSHPTEWTGHSEYDDEHAFTRRTGAISIVAPHYGACASGLHDCGVHMCEAGTWRQLDAAEIDRYVRVIPSKLDFRP